MVQIRTSLMFLIIFQLIWLSSSSFVNHKPFGDTVLETQQKYEDLPVKLIVAAEFDEENSTLVFQHKDGRKIVANLEVEDDCIFRGSILGCPTSTVLVTGCKGHLQGVQIQSKLYGDMIFTMQNGEVMPLGSKRYKRDADLDIDFDYCHVLDNPEFDIQYPGRASAEVDDLPPPPSKVELHLNVYLDRNWNFEFGGIGGPQFAKKILKHAASLLNHESLNTKIELFYDEANFYTSSEHLLISSNVYDKKLPQQLVGPNLTSRGEPTAHLYLTVEGEAEKSYNMGQSRINSMCGFGQPRSIVKYKDDEVRTAMTVAHELGHLLGLQHDFDLHNFDEISRKCGPGKFEGLFVMNYGDNRQSFSECSNLDFKIYYHRVVLEKKNFCLTEGVVGCHCNGFVNAIGSGGKCEDGPQGPWCYVNKDSGCKDIRKFHEQFVSSSPCKSEQGQEEEQKAEAVK